MSDSDSSKSESDQPLAKRAKLYNDTLSSELNQHTQDQLNTRHTINDIVNDKKKEYQQRYRERNRDKLKQREMERRKRIRDILSIAGSSISSNMNRIESNNKEIIAAISQCSSGLGGTQSSCIQRHKQAKEKKPLQRKKEYQQRYRERNRDKLKKREMERRKRIRDLLSIVGSSISSNMNRIESNNEEIIAAISQCSSGLGETQSSCIQRHKQAKRKKPLQRKKDYQQKKREYQQRYREQNREKLKQREAERRRRLHNAKIITELSTSSNIEYTELVHEPIIDEISANSVNVAGLENIQHLFVEVSQQNERGQSSAHGTEITNNHSKFRCHQLAHEYFNDKVEDLFICNRHDDLKFYHGRRIDSSVSSLQEEFRRSSLNNLITLRELITDFMNNSNTSTIYTLNCQSFRKHASDLRDSNCQNSNFLLLTETWLPTDESLDLPNFNCIAKFKRQDVRAAGVAIYQSRNTSNIITVNMDLAIQNATEVHVSQTSIGDICYCHITLQDGRELVMIVVYISPNKKMNDIILFLHERLFSYSRRGSMIFKTKKHELPLILAGDFNVNFAENESMPLTTFLQEEFQLQINNNPREHTTRYGTTIDAVFIRYLDNVMSNTFITYCSCHRPIVTVIPTEAASNITIA